ncbi:tyrosine-type recombinase/integrase [Streptomyces sp. NPDC051366]|uniref:tyrosine-type recombinase/integrase n=1 Tax=Streptomyces sp. NPDC051366 TaxID=3365652 RepID=UPI00378E9051
MRPVLTHRLIPVDDSQHAVMLIDMLNQFTHGGTISAPTDNPARRAPEASDPHHRTSRGMQHARRSASRTVPRRATCSIATRGHPHTVSADTRHACATHNYESGMPLWDVQVLLGHVWASTTVGYLATAKGDPERASLESSRRAVRRLSTEA